MIEHDTLPSWTAGEQVNRVAGLAMVSKPSVDFTGYWQRHLHS
jgi:hypothetical protein